MPNERGECRTGSKPDSLAIRFDSIQLGMSIASSRQVDRETTGLHPNAMQTDKTAGAMSSHQSLAIHTACNLFGDAAMKGLDE
jgi:hypothetical protein